jgi:hypothetical protein
MIKAQQTLLPGPRGRHHDIFLVTLIALRPLIWSGDAGAWDNLAWLLLVCAALIALVVDAWRGRLVAWQCGIGGVLGAALVLMLLPAALRSPFPATGMALWGMAIVHLGFAAYVLQVLAGRERLAFAALAAALVLECLVALGQWWWVLPGMTAALAAGDPTVLAIENTHNDLAERLENGGLFGTFTLANTLAAFLLLSGVPFLGYLRHPQKHIRLLAIALLLLITLIALGTASKGAAVAWLVAAATVWTLHQVGRWRFVPLLVLVLVGVIAAVVPQVRHLAEASAQVRLGYWAGATTLITEAPLVGHGVHGFTAHASRTMPLDAEPTQHVHNDVLEATVDGGLLAGLALTLVLLWSTRQRVPTPRASELDYFSDEHQRPTLPAVWPLLIAFPLFCALGMLFSNIGWWPGGGDQTWWLWPLVLAAIAMGVTFFVARLELPPPWAFQLALIAFALHCLLDFNLQSPAIWGTFIIISLLAGGRV